MSVCGRSRILVLSVRILLGPPLVYPVGVSRFLSSSACVFSVGEWRRAGVGGCRVDLESRSSGRTYRNLSATVAISFLNQLRPLSRYDPLDLGEVEENTRKALTCKHLRRFIVHPDLAQLVTEHITPDIEEGKAVIFECNPGPGVLTRTLLNCGVQRLVVLESEKSFLPELQEMAVAVHKKPKDFDEVRRELRTLGLRHGMIPPAQLIVTLLLSVNEVEDFIRQIKSETS